MMKDCLFLLWFGENESDFQDDFERLEDRAKVKMNDGEVGGSG